MKASIGHLQFNIHSDNHAFYHELSDFLGWGTLYDEAEMLGVDVQGGASLWFASFETKDVANDYDGPGLNHLGISADSIAEVDAAAAWLGERGIEMLFDTPRHRPDFTEAGSTYYQIMFETPDRLLFEIVYTGPI